ncbi:Unknown protein, partial [Striga hermonthica]
IMAHRNARNCQPTPSPPPSPSPSRPRQQALNPAGAHLNILIQFRQLTPPTFTGVEGPEAVAEWIRQLEQNFDLLYYRMRMERAFWDLKQGAGLVEEYEREFTRMSAFAPHMVDTDLKKAHKFQDGLNRTLRSMLPAREIFPLIRTLSEPSRLESYQTLDASVPSAQLVQPIFSAPPGSSSGKRKFDSHWDNRKGKRGAPDRVTFHQLPMVRNRNALSV